MLPADGGPPHLLVAASGPPLCVIDDYAYQSTSFQCAAGDTLVLSTDGIQEARDVTGALYGRERFANCLAGWARGLAVSAASRRTSPLSWTKLRSPTTRRR